MDTHKLFSDFDSTIRLNNSKKSKLKTNAIMKSMVMIQTVNSTIEVTTKKLMVTKSNAISPNLK